MAGISWIDPVITQIDGAIVFATDGAFTYKVEFDMFAGEEGGTLDHPIANILLELELYCLGRE